jgi:uncharacterized protein (TIGR02246 family)
MTTVASNTTVPAPSIEATFTGLAAAWNRADSTAFGALFTDDADFIEIRGGHHRGRDAIAAGHQGLWSTIYRGSTVEYRVESVRVLDCGYLVGIVGATMHAPSGPLAGTNHSRISAVLAVGDGSARIVSFHNTLVVSGHS